MKKGDAVYLQFGNREHIGLVMHITPYFVVVRINSFSVKKVQETELKKVLYKELDKYQ